jgi:hypothetical protein
MPNPDIIRNTLALGAEVDARAFASVNVFDRGVANYSLSASVGLFWDVPAMCHGYGSTLTDDLASLMATAWTAAGALGGVTCGIDEADLFYIHSDTETFTLWALTANAVFGFSTAGAGPAPAHPSGGWRLTATSPWQRGIVDQPVLVVDTATVPGGFGLPGTNRRVQCLPVWLRKRGVIADSDDVFSGLTIEDADAAVANGVRWLVLPDGRVEASWLSAAGLADVTWVDETMMVLLGFVGDEASTLNVGCRVQVGTNPAAPFLAPSRMASWLRSRVDEDVSVARMADGSHTSSHQGPYDGWTLRQRVDGRVGSTEDLQAHLRRFWAYALPGRPMTIYPQWGDLDSLTLGSMDTRRHRDLADAQWVGGGPGTGTLTPYDLLVTGEADARAVNARVGGRLLVVRGAKDSNEKREDYGGRQLDQFQDVELSFDADPSR